MVEDELDHEVAPFFPGQVRPHPQPRSVKGNISAAATGTANHKFLQHFSMARAVSLPSFADEATRLERAGILSAEERLSLNLGNIKAFWDSDVGQRVRRQATGVKRELAFTARFRPQELDELLNKKPDAGLEHEFVVVQGVADLAVVLPEEIWLVDFKTDEIRADELAAKVNTYAPQLKLYASALAKIYARPVTNVWLHFLSARATVPVKP